MTTGSVFGVFRYEDEFVHAVHRLSADGHARVSAMSPVPVEEVLETLRPGSPPIRFFTFFGALLGAVCGMALAVWSALAFILPSGGRAIIPLPPFLIISYEVTILFGVLATLIGFFLVSRLPATRDRPYLPATNVDRFGILVECEADAQLLQAERILREAGAEEVHLQGASS